MVRVMTQMHTKLKLLALLIALLALFSGSGMVASAPASALSLPTHSVTAAAFATCQQEFFGLDPWYKYMQKEFDPGTCDVKCFNIFPMPQANDCDQTRSDIPGILLVVVDDLLRVAALIAVGFVLVGSFKFVTSRGSPDKAAQAQSTIIDALIGLVIAMSAVGFIAFVGGKLV